MKDFIKKVKIIYIVLFGIVVFFGTKAFMGDATYKQKRNETVILDSIRCVNDSLRNEVQNLNLKMGELDGTIEVLNKQLENESKRSIVVNKRVTNVTYVQDSINIKK